MRIMRFQFGMSLASLVVAPATALALPNCAGLGTHLQAQQFISEVTATLFGGGSPRCEVDFTYSAKSGPQHGYAEGQNQRIRIRVGLPLNSVDGGSGGVEGAWNGKLQNLGGGGLAGAVGSVTGPTNTGYVGTSTDTGHTVAENGAFGNWGVIQDLKKLNLGKIRDFAADSIEQQFMWGKALALVYYGTPATRNYWNGCSTGGRQGLHLAREFGDQFDGFVLGAPAHYHQGRRLSDGLPSLVLKKLGQKGKSITTAQRNAARDAAIAACDALDGVTDGLLNDPRVCTWSAVENICGAPNAPAAPNCLDADQAAAVDAIWDGPRNASGKRIMIPYDRNLNWSTNASIGGGAAQAIKWNHKDLDYDLNNTFLDDESVALAGNPPGAMTYEEEAVLGSKTVGDYIDSRSTDLKKALKNGAKLLMWHGGQDNLIRSALTIDYYAQAAHRFGGGTPDFAKIQSWFRFFLAPGVDHCGGGPGPQPQDLFGVLVNWVENGVAPDQILASGGGRTRPLCPFPQTAIYNGSGSTDDVANFHCGGDLQTTQAICHGLITKYKKEDKNAINAMGKYNLSACTPKKKDKLASQQ